MCVVLIRGLYPNPHFFANNCLPPLSPFGHSESSMTSSNSSLKDAVMEEIYVSSLGPPLSPSLSAKNVFQGSDNLPPGKGHRPSSSDVPLGFSAMIKSSPQLVPISGQAVSGKTLYVKENLGNNKNVGLNVKGIGVMKSEGDNVDDLFNSLMNLDQVDSLTSLGGEDKDKDKTVSGTQISGGDNSNTEPGSISKHESSSREGVKRIAAGDIAPPSRHYRSLSMDSAFGNLQFGNESSKLPYSLGNPAGQLSPSNSMTENTAKLNLEFGHGQFSEVEIKKIMADERLSEIAFADPKRVKRILANRQSAARSKERKLHYISELEYKVQMLQKETTTMSAQLTILKKNHAELKSANNELKFRFQAMEKQGQLRDDLHEALNAEVQHLKLAHMKLSEEGRMKHRMFQVQSRQPSQNQRLSVPTSTTQTPPSTAPASA